mmetsp:Transcript_2619/g.7848  ORF Transcript_2619/g.7848 Transcript_2619/m.7848 type:complete len:221 (+) Transcript_2619:656-1318(+)
MRQWPCSASLRPTWKNKTTLPWLCLYADRSRATLAGVNVDHTFLRLDRSTFWWFAETMRKYFVCGLVGVGLGCARPSSLVIASARGDGFPTRSCGGPRVAIATFFLEGETSPDPGDRRSGGAKVAAEDAFLLEVTSALASPFGCWPARLARFRLNCERRSSTTLGSGSSRGGSTAASGKTRLPFAARLGEVSRSDRSGALSERLWGFLGGSWVSTAARVA